MKLETENILQQLFIHFFCVVEHEIWVIFIIRHRWTCIECRLINLTDERVFSDITHSMNI